MGVIDLFSEGAYRLALLSWVALVTLVAIVPVLFLTVLFVAADVILLTVSTVLPGVGPINFRFIFGKKGGPGAYLVKWYKWIAANMNRIISSAASQGRWVPPILP